MKLKVVHEKMGGDYDIIEEIFEVKYWTIDNGTLLFTILKPSTGNIIREGDSLRRAIAVGYWSEVEELGE